MRKEISWEFSRKRTNDTYRPAKSLDSHVRFVMSGRTGFDLIIQDLNRSGRRIRSVYFPSFCSRSMMQAFADNEILIKFYTTAIRKTGFVFCAPTEYECDAIVLIDYFGYCIENLEALAKEARSKGCIVITDITQSLFCKRDYFSFSDYVVGSFRKWLPSNSAFVYSRTSFVVDSYSEVSREYELKRNTAYGIKEQYIQGENYKAEDFINLFDQSELLLKTDYRGYAASQKEVDYFLESDFAGIRRRRVANARRITELLNSEERLRPIFPSVKQCDCPLYVPLLLDSEIDRSAFRNRLFEKNVFLPVHWRPSYLHPKGCEDLAPYTSVISCICDQRYNRKDMRKLCDTLISCLD